jgi:hypothetical protein
MSGALVGFRIGSENKLLRLHGERSCEGVLGGLLAYLRSVNDARLEAYARSLKAVTPADGLFPGDMARTVLQAFFEDHLGESCRPQTWAEAFATVPELEGWHAGFPYAQAAQLDACGDVVWGFLINLDAGELQIFVNRNALFQWHEIAGAQPADCALPLAHVRQLTANDLAALHGLLNQHSYSDGIDPVLPVRAALSAPFPGPGAWQARLKLAHGRARLLLERGPVTAKVRRVAELRLDDPHCGALLHEALDPQVLALALAIYGPAARLAQVAQVAEHLAQLPFAPQLGGLPLLDLGLRPSSGLGLVPGPAFFDSVRACFLAAGMSTQGWRFLIRQDNDVLRFLLQFFPPSARILRDFTRFINLLASALQSEPLRLGRCQAALRGVERILDRTRGRPGPMREENARIFVRAIMRARLSAQDEASLAHDAQDVSDFVYTHAAVLKGATWRSLCRRSDDWHRALLITVDPEKDVRWPALLPRYATGPFLAVELDCGFLLAEEGLEQRHCIGTYVNACSSGASRVFSLRRNGRRTATIELQRAHDGSWRMVQIRGKANAMVQDPAVLAAGEAVARAYSAAARRREHVELERSHQALKPGAYVQPAYLIHRQEHWTG